MNKKISIILPTYNEKENIIALADEIHTALAAYETEIIVVDDNSPDGTYQIAAGSNRPFIKALLRTKDPSLGKSIRAGIEAASGDVMVIMDSDFNHQPKYLPFMIESLLYYDCVSASRFLYGGQMNSVIRHYLSWLFNIFIRIITGGEITDSLYGYLAIKRETIERCNYDAVFWGYGDYCIRLLYYLQKMKVPVLQFPAINGDRKAGQGNRRLGKAFLQYFGESLRLAWRERILRKNRRGH